MGFSSAGCDKLKRWDRYNFLFSYIPVCHASFIWVILNDWLNSFWNIVDYEVSQNSHIIDWITGKFCITQIKQSSVIKIWFLFKSKLYRKERQKIDGMKNDEYLEINNKL